MAQSNNLFASKCEQEYFEMTVAKMSLMSSRQWGGLCDDAALNDTIETYINCSAYRIHSKRAKFGEPPISVQLACANSRVASRLITRPEIFQFYIPKKIFYELRRNLEFGMVNELKISFYLTELEYDKNDEIINSRPGNISSICWNNSLTRKNDFECQVIEKLSYISNIINEIKNLARVILAISFISLLLFITFATK
jgi:hypothetical protein